MSETPELLVTGSLPTDTPNAEEGMVALSHYPLPYLYRKAEAFATSNKVGPMPYAATEIYYRSRYPTISRTFNNNLGSALFYSALTRIAPKVEGAIRLIETKQQLDKPLVSLVPLFLKSTLHLVARRKDPVIIDHVRYTVTKIMEFLDYHNDSGLPYLFAPFLPVIDLLHGRRFHLQSGFLKDWHHVLEEATNALPIPVEVLVESIDAFGEESVAQYIPEPTQEQYKQMKAERERPKDETKDELALVPKTPKEIEQLDGSKAPSAKEAFRECFRPEVKEVGDIKDQLRLVLERHENPYKDYLVLWWKSRRDKYHSDVELIQTRMLDSVARTLKAMFTQEQVEALAKQLPIDEVVDGVMNFISSYERELPDMTWPQFRTSILSLPVSRLSSLSKDNIIDYAVSLYEAVGLHEDIALLRATLDCHLEALEVNRQRASEQYRMRDKH
jgi:hypothetical protein